MIPAFSVSLYRLMMRVYPAEFRIHYGEAVDQAFRDNVRDAVEKRGYLGLALLWFHVVPDFLFSYGELLLSKAGDFLKWRFRLQWVVACSLGFALSRGVTLMFGQELYRELRARGTAWIVLGTTLGMVIRLLCLGWMQSRVLAGRCFRRKQWVLYGVAGAVVSSAAIQALFPLIAPGELRLFELSRSSRLLQTLAYAVVPSAPMVILGACIGAFQSAAVKNDAITRYRWMTACAAGYFLSAVAGGFSIPYPMMSVLDVVVNSVVSGALLGLLTCGPLERILFSVQGNPQDRS